MSVCVHVASVHSAGQGDCFENVVAILPLTFVPVSETD